eukprot:4196654-Amphidinium_carterae.2
MFPVFGVSHEQTQRSTQDEQANGWEDVRRKKCTKVSRPEVPPEPSGLKVGERQFVFDGEYIPNRLKLIKNKPGVLLIENLAEFQAVLAQPGIVGDSAPQVT